jgi:hypothetical protein
MILFYGEGRLGNQIFQYLALTSIARPGERILAIGLEDLQQSFNLKGPRLSVLSRNALVKRAVKYIVLPLLIRPCARILRLFDYVFEAQWSPNGEQAAAAPRRRSGALRRLTFVDGGFYQSASLWPSIFPNDSISIREELRRSAQDYLNSACGEGTEPSFVHVRRGDYLHHRPQGLDDVVLPIEFYRHALESLELRTGKKPLVFVTDDPAWVEANFRDISDKRITAFDAHLDFAIMTQCRSGILSNSTFALAAAIMMNRPDVVIAARFWLGFRAHRWVPPGIEATHDSLVYLPAEPAERMQ